MSQLCPWKIDRIQAVLNHYYPSPPVPLDSINDFTFLIAVVLSAQTTDGKVNEVTKHLFKIAPTPAAMSALDPEYVLKLIRPVGLAPKKSQYIVQLSRIIQDRFNGHVPASYKELESLPGVGHKTASVIMSQLFGEPSFAVDTHVHRLALRWGITKELSNVDKVQADLCRQFPQDAWNKLHLQMIYFGREYCAAKEHKAEKCPICSWVKKSEGNRLLEVGNACFDKAKVVKGLVYYDDREKQLRMDSSLSHCSPNKQQDNLPMATLQHSDKELAVKASDTKLEFMEASGNAGTSRSISRSTRSKSNIINSSPSKRTSQARAAVEAGTVAEAAAVTHTRSWQGRTRAAPVRPAVSDPATLDTLNTCPPRRGKRGKRPRSEE